VGFLTVIALGGTGISLSIMFSQKRHVHEEHCPVRMRSITICNGTWVIDQACSVKMAGHGQVLFLRVYGPRTLVSCGTQWVISSRQICSSLPFTELMCNK